MTNSMRVSAVSAIAFFMFSAASAFAGSAFDQLKPAIQERIKNGEMITFTAKSNESAWPQVWVYLRADATPEELAAMYTDYDLQKEFIPDAISSKIQKQVDKTTAEVLLMINTHFPLVPRERNLLRYHLSTYDAAAAYMIEWNLLSADQLKGLKGSVRIEALETGSMIAYYNLVTPPSIASGEPQRAIEGTQKAVRNMATRIQTLRTTNRGLLDQEIQVLRGALEQN